MGPVVPADRGDVVGEQNPPSNPLLLPSTRDSQQAPPSTRRFLSLKSVRSGFTDETELLTLLRGTVDISDDCGTASYTNIVLFSACKESTVTVEIENRCGNAATEVIPVWFDPTPPTIQATIANSVLDSTLEFVFGGRGATPQLHLHTSRHRVRKQTFPFTHCFPIHNKSQSLRANSSMWTWACRI